MATKSNLPGKTAKHSLWQPPSKMTDTPTANAKHEKVDPKDKDELLDVFNAIKKPVCGLLIYTQDVEAGLL